MSVAFSIAEGTAKAFLKTVPRPERFFRLTFDFGAGEGTYHFYFRTRNTELLQAATDMENDELLTKLVSDLAYDAHTRQRSPTPIDKDTWTWLVSVEEIAKTPQEGWGVFEGAAKQFLKGLARRRKLEVGELVSSHTLNSRDLIHNFLDAIRNMSEETYAQIVDDEVEEYLQNRMSRSEVQDFEDDYLHERLWPTLSQFCPPMTFFGSHPGNGSDIGCWPLEAHEYEELNDEGKIIYVPLWNTEAGRFLDTQAWPDLGEAKYLVRELGHATYACYDRNHTKLWEGSL